MCLFPGGGAYSYDGRHKVPTPSQLARSYSFMQRRERERERDGDRDEDDSMHEKYFMNPVAIRSVESTPQTRRYVTFILLAMFDILHAVLLYCILSFTYAVLFYNSIYST